MPLVSIITPTYNSSNYITNAYESILSQTHQNWEWLVTDDCSTDNTIDVLNDISSSDSRVKIYKNPVNSGAAASRNLSLKRATGLFVCFLDSDDVWLPNKLDRQIKFMGEEIDFSFTSYELIDDHGLAMGKKIDVSHQTLYFTYEDMLKKRATLGCSTVMLRKDKIGLIQMPLLRTGQDYALWLKLLKQGHHAFLLKDNLTKYRISPNSISRNKVKKAKRQWQIYRDVEKLSLTTALNCFSHYAWRAIFRL